MVESLSHAWQELTGSSPPDSLVGELLEAYREPHRAYHTLHHVEDCLRQFDLVRGCARYGDEVTLALWFHDAVYDTRAQDNEARSANWVSEALTQAGADAEVTERVRSLILATRHDERAVRGDEAIMCDVDLAILGRDADSFARYDDQIRQEYSWVEASAYRTGRIGVLERFLRRPRIFHTAEFFGKYESQARENLSSKIDELSRSPSAMGS